MQLTKIKKEDSSTKEDMAIPMGDYHLPNLYLSSKQVPEIADWEVGEKYKIVLEVKQVASRIESNMDKERINADFKVLAYKVIKEDDDLEELQAEALSSK